MGVLDGFEDVVLSIYKVGTSLKHDENEHLHINDHYLTSHIKSTFPDLYINEYLNLYAECLYKVDRASVHEVGMLPDRRVQTLYDQTLSELNATQATTANQPILCTSAQRHKKRYYITFSKTRQDRMISNIDLSPVQGQSNIVNIFMVYPLKTCDGSYWTCNGLFGHDDGGHDKFVSFGANSGDLVVSGTTGDYIVVGAAPVNGKPPIANYPTCGNAGELNQWVVLSIHWVIDAAPTNKSTVWCNGIKLCNFTARASTGSTQMTFGDLNPSGIAPLDGDVSFFALYKSFALDEELIKLHHLVLVNRYK